GPDQLSFYHHPRYLDALRATRAGAVILDPAQASATSGAVLFAAQPYLAFARASALFARPRAQTLGIHPSATLDPSVVLGADVSVGPHAVIGSGTVLGQGVCIGAGCVIGRDCRIGAGSRLNPNVTLYDDVYLGQRALIHANVVIGSDGFGFAPDGKAQVKIHQLGGVRIGDDVEVGASTTIDRGALEHTRIGDGVKIDNQVQIAHNVRIGDNSVICGCSAIAGSSSIGKNCIIAGAVGVINHVHICDGVTVTAMSLVNQSIATPGVYSSGTGLLQTSHWKKTIVRFKQLDAIHKRLSHLEQRLLGATDDGHDA
ncbi:MAG: UDP-3-O-(3-hydroxymyristoyl)glucosamine N-acyltransferase, partial [Pseudomonadales bacterium]|nr:UDP-3-O-(3-hydroxymyristoyl)glucosamine N-acyltransferase [Pseudomonadales bacterium]